MQTCRPSHVDGERLRLMSHGAAVLNAFGGVVRKRRVGAWPPPCEALLRSAAAAVMLLAAFCVAGCEVEPSSLPSWAAPSIDRSQGVSAALGVSAHAASITRAIDALPESTCRAGLGDQTWMQAQVRACAGIC